MIPQSFDGDCHRNSVISAMDGCTSSVAELDPLQSFSFPIPSMLCKYQLSCPFESPWQSEPTLGALQDASSSNINLDEFMPLKDLMDANLHSLDSCGSEQSTCQVRTCQIIPLERMHDSNEQESPSGSKSLGFWRQWIFSVTRQHPLHEGGQLAKSVGVGLRKLTNCCCAFKLS